MSSPSQKFLLLLVKILLIVLILLWLAPLVNSKKKRRKQRKNKTLKAQIHRNRLDCETECLELIPEESMNCILECWSPACFQQIYGGDDDDDDDDGILEPGQVDIPRAKRMDDCVQQELKQQRKEEREQRKRNLIEDNAGTTPNSPITTI